MSRVNMYEFPYNECRSNSNCFTRIDEVKSSNHVSILKLPFSIQTAGDVVDSAKAWPSFTPSKFLIFNRHQHVPKLPQATR